jgi:hypothetical protein
MIKKLVLLVLSTMSCVCIDAQKHNTCQEQAWVDSVFKECYNKKQYVFDSNKMNEQSWIDSIFNENFNEMQLAVDSNKMYDIYVDRVFVYLLSYMSGIECTTIDYSGFCYFDKKKLEEWENWFEINKHEISVEKVIWGLNFLRNDHKTEEGWDTLHNLRIPPKKE